MINTLLTIIMLLVVAGCRPSSPRERIPTGTINDCMKSQNAFYTIRGGFDYSRTPVLYPIHLLKVAGSIDLCSGKDGLAQNLLSIGMSKGFIYGNCGSYHSFGKTTPESWFVIEVQTSNMQQYQTKTEFFSALKSKGVDTLSLLPAKDVMESFTKRGIDQFKEQRKQTQNK